MAYDPVKAHEYYERTKELLGESKKHNVPQTPQSKVRAAKKAKPDPKAEKAKLASIARKLSKLNKALKEANDLLAEKRRSEQKSRTTAKKTEKENSDGKSSVSEKNASEKYREKNKAKLASKGKAEAAKAPKKPADMSVDELEDRVDKIRGAIKLAKSQLNKANSMVGSIKHSDTNSSDSLTLEHNSLRKETVKMAPTLTKKPDFGGYATKAGLECADGLTIQRDAFKDQDGAKIPLVYQHGHKDPGNVLGHAILENREDGVYAHCYFNGSASAEAARHAVEHEDLTMMSIFANRLKKRSQDVFHGVIREVSLVMAGANPGAVIDFVEIRHSDEVNGDWVEEIDDAFITTGIPLQHSAPADADPAPVEIDETVAHGDYDPDEIYNSLNDTQKEFVHDVAATIAAASVQHSDDDPEPVETPKEPEVVTPDAPTEATPTDTPETPAPEPANPEPNAPAPAEPVETTDPNAPAPVEQPDPNAPAPAEQPDLIAEPSATSDITHSDPEGNNMTTNNVFTKKAADTAEHSALTPGDEGYTLTHDDMAEILSEAKRPGVTMARAVKDFALQHGIEQIDVLFPDAKAVADRPEWITRRTEWVARVLQGTHHTPFSRIKSLTADLTLDDARAKGYIKGNLKKEQFFEVSKRVTTPQTIYKKQKLDRDDILDITDFDVVAWIKGEMRLMLDEELARAILIGDGRSNADDDKIVETNIRPIATDHELYQTTFYLNLGDANSSAEEIVDSLLLQRRHYRGSGNPIFFTTELVISQILNVKDTTGRRIYANLQDLATTLRVSEIIPVEAMVSQPDLIGIVVNLSDYTVGADRGGDISLFDDFDIDYNAYKYLIETRVSGALTKFKSALVLRRSADNSVLATPGEPTFASHAVSVPSVEGLVYKNQDTNATLVAGTPVVLGPDDKLTVVAVPAGGGYHIGSTAADEWSFDYDGKVAGPF
jgi:hypothetical protein